MKIDFTFAGLIFLVIGAVIPDFDYLLSSAFFYIIFGNRLDDWFSEESD